MKKSLATALFCLLALSLAVGQEAGAAKSGKAKSKGAASGGVEAQITKLEQDWGQASVKDLASAVDQYEADDIMNTDPSGRTTDKAQDKQDASGDLKFQALDLSDMKVHSYGNTAVVNGIVNVKGSYKGQDISGKYRFTDTWVKRNGKWLVAATQSTKIQQQ